MQVCCTPPSKNTKRVYSPSIIDLKKTSQPIFVVSLLMFLMTFTMKRVASLDSTATNATAVVLSLSDETSLNNASSSAGAASDPSLPMFDPVDESESQAGIAVDRVPMQQQQHLHQQSGNQNNTAQGRTISTQQERNLRKMRRELKLLNAHLGVCDNNGTFVNGKCHCPYPFVGPRCADFACEHGLSVGPRRCICEDDWTGELCNIPIADQCNGRGQYTNKGRCKCHGYYFGPKVSFARLSHSLLLLTASTAIDFVLNTEAQLNTLNETPVAAIRSLKIKLSQVQMGQTANSWVRDNLPSLTQGLTSTQAFVVVARDGRLNLLLCQYVSKCVNGRLQEGACNCIYGYEGDYCDKIVCHHGYPDKANESESCVCPPRHTGKFCDECLLGSELDSRILHHILPFPNCTEERIPYKARISREKTDDRIWSRIVILLISTGLLILLFLIMIIMHWGRRRAMDPVVDVEKRRAVEERKELLERAIYLQSSRNSASNTASLLNSTTARRSSRFLDPNRLDHDLL